MRVLLVEDDKETAQSINLMLKTEGLNVYTTERGEEGIDLAKMYDYDIILLDLNLPDMPGYEVLRSLQMARVAIPILILSGLATIEDKIRGLGLGADDYLSKPFHRDELVARIHAIVRRSKGHAQSRITTGDLVVNLDAKNAELNGEPIRLTGKEYEILELLALRNILYHDQNPLRAVQLDFRGQHLARELTAVAAAKQHVALSAAAMQIQQTIDGHRRRLGLPGVEQLQHRNSDEILAAAAEHRIEGGIGEFDAAAEIHENDSLAHGVQDHRLSPQHLLGAPP